MITDSKLPLLFNYNSVFNYDSDNTSSKGVNRSFYKSAFTFHSFNLEKESDIDESKDESWLSSVLRHCIIIFLYLLMFLTFPVSIWICIKKIHALERMVLMRLGKLQNVRGPGFSFVLPIIDNWTRVDLQSQSFTLTAPQLLTADGAIIGIKSDIEYQVSDVISYATKLNEQQKTLKDLAFFCLKNIVSGKDQYDLENNRELISFSLMHGLNQSTLKWGLEVLNVHIHLPIIVKAAQPMDTFGTLITVLKVATGNTSPHATAIFPFISDDSTQDNIPFSKEIPKKQNTALGILKNSIQDAKERGHLQDLTAKIKLDIVGNSTDSVYCSIENGCAIVEDEPKPTWNDDVCLTITEDNFKAFLDGKISPLDTYMNSKVTGDFSLLQLLAKIFQK